MSEAQLRQIDQYRRRVKTPRSVFTALAWKQFREFTALFAILAFALVGWCLFVALIATNKNFFSLMIFSIPFTIVCGLAVALPLIAFTGEKESGTVNMLAQLPVSSYTVGLSKFIACAMTMTAFWVIEVGALFIAHKMYGEPFAFTGTTLFSIVLSCLSLATSLVCAIRCKSSMNAITITAGSVVVVFILATALAGSLDRYRFFVGFELLDALLIGLALAMLVVAFVSVGNWLRPLSRSGSLAGIGTSRWAKTPSSAASRNTLAGSSESLATRKASTAKSGMILQMLLWQSVRQQRASLILAAVISVLITFLACLTIPIISRMRSDWGRFEVNFSEHIHLIGIGFAIVGFVLGMGSILHDKTKSRFLFFQQLREHGRLFWLSRILLPVSVLLVASLACGFLLSGGVAYMGNARLDASPSSLALFAGLSSFGASLLWGFVCKSNVFVSLFGFATCLVIGVVGTMLVQMDPGAMFIGFLLPISLLAITWLYAPVWLSGVENYVWYLLIGLMVSATLVFIATTIMSHRLNSANRLVANWTVYEAHQKEKLGPYLTDIVAPTINATQEHRLEELLKTNPKSVTDASSKSKDGLPDIGERERERVRLVPFKYKVDEELINLLIGNREAIAIRYGNSYNNLMSIGEQEVRRKRSKIQDLLRLERTNADSVREFYVMRSLQMMSRTDGFDEGFGNLLSWIESGERTVDELLAAIEDLQEFRPGSFLKGIETHAWQSVSRADIDDHTARQTIGTLLAQIPWERDRMAILFSVEGRTMDEVLLMLEELNKVSSVFNRETALLYQGWKTKEFFPELVGNSGSHLPYAFSTFVNQDRYLMLRAALEIYKKREGNYPKSLKQLVPDTIPVLPVYVGGDDFGFINPEALDRQVIMQYGVEFQVVTRPVLLLVPASNEEFEVNALVEKFESDAFYYAKIETVRNLKKAIEIGDIEGSVRLFSVGMDGFHFAHQFINGNDLIEEGPWALGGSGQQALEDGPVDSINQDDKESPSGLKVTQPIEDKPNESKPDRDDSTAKEKQSKDD